MSFVFISAVAAPLKRNGTTHDGHHVLRMGDGDLHFTITPAVAQQWADVLTTITEEETKA